MPDIIFNNFFDELAKGNTNLISNDIKCALMTETYIPDKDDDIFDNTNEVSGTGYTAVSSAKGSKF